MDNRAGLDSLFDLMARTDDQAIRFEACRIFVNVIRSFAKDSAPLSAVATERIIGYLCELIQLGIDKPVLVNEGLIALSLLATFADASAMVREKIIGERLHEGPGSALVALSTSLAVQRDDPAYEGIWKNAATLVNKLLPNADGSMRDRLEAFLWDVTGRTI